jgi:hypothetical protein
MADQLDRRTCDAYWHNSDSSRNGARFATSGDILNIRFGMENRKSGGITDMGEGRRPPPAARPEACSEEPGAYSSRRIT